MPNTSYWLCDWENIVPRSTLILVQKLAETEWSSFDLILVPTIYILLNTYIVIYNELWIYKFLMNIHIALMKIDMFRHVSCLLLRITKSNIAQAYKWRSVTEYIRINLRLRNKINIIVNWINKGVIQWRNKVIVLAWHAKVVYLIYYYIYFFPVSQS